MYGLIVKLTVLPGTRKKMVAILKDSAANMPGCLSYMIGEDSTDANVLWVTEVWNNQGSHDASLSLPAVKNATPRAKGLSPTSRR